MDNITKELIEAHGTFTGKVKYGICKEFKWHEYRYKNKYYNISQFDNQIELIGGYSNLTGRYTKNLKEGF